MRYDANALIREAEFIMKRVKPNLVLLAFLFLLCGHLNNFAQKMVQVTGRALDGEGLPISNATVVLHTPPCHNCIDHVLPATRSLPDGVFFIDSAGISLKKLELFIEGPLPKDYWSAFGGAPFDRLSHLSSFKGIPIRLRKGRVRVDMGDVIVKVLYGRVVIELPKVLGDKYTPSRNALKELNFTLRDAKGKIIYNGQIPELGFDPTFSCVNLALTKGTWNVELSYNNQEVQLRSPSLSINIKDLDCKKVTLVDGRQSEQACQ